MISVVTPTFQRPAELLGLLENLSRQIVVPAEVIVIDGAPGEEKATEQIISQQRSDLPFACHYLRYDRGTAIQRNAGIERATGELVAFIDDDVRLEPDFLEKMAAVFAADKEHIVGGVVGYRTNQHFQAASSERWRWYRRLRLLTTFEPGRYDFQTGYPINANMQPPFTGVKEVDFMTTACAVWRREVFASGLRFDPFFRDYGVLEDAHFALRAGRRWKLLQCGDAKCAELSSPNGRVDRRRVGYKYVVNYYYVFKDVVTPLRLKHKLRFWRYQVFELLRMTASAIRRRRKEDVGEVLGRIEGFCSILGGTAFSR
jgi:GT2 family glycosyltransferase